MSKLTIYEKWSEVPEGLATKSALSRDHNLRPGPDQQPVAAKLRIDRKGKPLGGYYELYEIAEAIPKAEPTPEQVKALKKGRAMAKRVPAICVECNRHVFDQRTGEPVYITKKQQLEEPGTLCFLCSDRIEAAARARALLRRADGVILDSETTGLGGEMIEIAVIDTAGKTLFNRRIKPQAEVSPGAQDVHGISNEMLENEPAFSEVYPELRAALEGRFLMVYNLGFDYPILLEMLIRNDLEQFEQTGTACLMELYAQYCGQYSHYYESYKWQKLPSGDHSALGDCRATLEVLREMSRYRIDSEGYDE